jgi:putative endonuclease
MPVASGTNAARHSHCASYKPRRERLAVPPLLHANAGSLDSEGMTGAMGEHHYFTYFVCSRTGTLYIGMTNDIDRRALQHKSSEIDGFASKHHCDRLVHYGSFDDVHKAIGREKQLKGWTRAKKIALIESGIRGGPTWLRSWERRCYLLGR